MFRAFPFGVQTFKCSIMSDLVDRGSGSGLINVSTGDLPTISREASEQRSHYDAESEEESSLPKKRPRYNFKAQLP